MALPRKQASHLMTTLRCTMPGTGCHRCNTLGCPRVIHMDEKGCPRCNPNFSHVNLPARLHTRGTLTLSGKRAEKPTLFSALEAISPAQRRKSSTLRLVEVKPDFLTEEGELWGPSWSGQLPPSSTRLPL